MGSRVQPGAEVDEQVYEQFKQFVKNRDGILRGNLGTALENAMKNYMESAQGGGSIERVEQDIATVNRNVAETRELVKHLAEQVENVEVDGGALTLSHDETTHTHRNESSSVDAPDDAPHPKASRAEKAAWVVAEHDSNESVARSALRETVEDEYAFNEQTTETLVERAFDDLAETREPHPKNDDLLVPPADAEELRQKEREAAEADAQAQADALDAAAPADGRADE